MLTLLLIAAVNTSIVVGWLLTGPRSVPFLTSQIESTLSGAIEGYAVDLSDVVLQWDGFTEGMGIYLSGVDIINADGAKLASVPHLKVTLDAMSLLYGRVSLGDAQIFDVNLHWDTSAHKPAPVPEGQVPAASSVTEKRAQAEAALAQFLKKLQPLRKHLPFRSLIIRNLTLYLDNPQQNTVWKFPQVKLSLAKVAGQTQLHVRATMSVMERPGLLTVDSLLPQEGGIDTQMQFEGVALPMLVDVFTEQLWLRQTPLTLNGKARFAADDNGRISDVGLEVFTPEGTTPQVSAKALVTNVEGKNLPLIALNAQAAHFELPELEHYWPPQMAAGAREWVMGAFTKGRVSTASAELNITPEDVETAHFSTESLKATVEFSGLDVRYVEGLPPLINTSGAVSFNGNSLKLVIDSATLLESPTKGEIRIFDLGGADERIEIEGVSSGKAYDVLELARIIKEAPEETPKVEGTAESTFHLSFPGGGRVNENNIIFNMASEFSNFSYPGMAKGMDLAGAKLKIVVDNAHQETSGEGYVNGVLCQIVSRETYSPGGENGSEFILETTLGAAELNKLTASDAADFTGSMALKVSSNGTGKNEKILVHADLKDVGYENTFLGFAKKQGNDGALDVTLEGKDGKQLAITSLEAKGKGFAISGTGGFNKETGLTALKLGTVEYGRNRYAVDVTKKSTGWVGTLKGRAIDIGGIVEHFIDTTIEHEMDITMAFDDVYLMNNQAIHQAKGRIHCGKQNCDLVDLSGTFGQGDRTRLVFAANGQPDSFNVTSRNAGALLSGFNILSNIRGGNMEMSATANQDRTRLLQNGKLIIKDFRAAEAPFLAKLFTLASFTGILDTLRGGGISFEKLKGEFAKNDDRLNIKDFKATGAALGITFDGDINFTSKVVNLVGAVTPAYAINNLFGKIPLVSNVLVGSKGEGLLAAQYKMVGPLENPEVSVNPLSIFTPGFLRSVWGDSNSRLNANEKDLQEIQKKQEEEKAKEAPAPAPAPAVDVTPKS